MLADPEYRKKVVEKITDPVVKSFWVNEFARYTQAYEVEATAAIQNKVGQFISNPLIRNIIGQVKSKIDMREIMDEGKILIANLSKGKIGEDNSRLLGALLITKLQLAAMSRVDIPEERRRDFFLYVDEFQNFATEAFVNILSEARKYRLSLVLANQYIAQLEEMTPLGKSTRVRDAIFGNVGTIIVFRVGAEDAEFLEKEFQPEFTAEDLINLEKYNVCIKLMIDGIASSPFSAITLPKREKPQKSYKDTIIRISRERFGTARNIIEEKIEKWAGTQTQVPTPKKQILYDAQCSECGKKIKVPFLPDPSRPVYCKSCLKKLEKGETISLSSLKPREEKPKEKKSVDAESIKKALEKILKKNEENR
jgi:CxxC-x17-CxxC domain-containing protein